MDNVDCPPSDIQNNYHLPETGEQSDAEITCKGKTGKVHECIICSRFKGTGLTHVSYKEEVETSKVNLDEEDSVRLEPVYLEQRFELWCLADFFPFPNLARYLEEDMIHDFAKYHESVYYPNMENDPQALAVSLEWIRLAIWRAYDNPNARVLQAIWRAYDNPNARVLQALLSIFTFLIEEHFPATSLQALKAEFPGLQKDLEVLRGGPNPASGTTEQKGYTLRAFVTPSSGDERVWYH
ncbi:hypothetical protein VMCG_06055 [Cytospora schulzeri]|uniref:Uncharacterized protein n=1 Tax=Cytospora schulzeri TaxID=448051 RepID=A0A423WGC3_9PEZI|nr:hypothetical protein VMCG_06055 [Valsa malicola]